MKKILLLLFVTTFINQLQGQDDGCDGDRFFNNVFTEIKVTKDLKFGEGTTLFGNFQELFLDVYEPEGDDLEMRPVVILAFGGSYIGGEKENLEFLCEAYARRGYVAVTIDYRIFDGPLVPFPSADQMKNVVVKSVSDMKAAIRYMRQDADTDNLFRINPDLVFVGGISAGSITAFHTAALDVEDPIGQDILDIIEDNGGIDGNSSDNMQYSSEVQGVINFSGGLNNALMIDENDPPFVSVHDERDPVVPYADGFASVFGVPIIFMEGSKRCQEVGDSLGVENTLKTIPNSNLHVTYFLTDALVDENVSFTTTFLGQIICENITINTEDFSPLQSIEVSPNPSSGLFYLDYDNALNLDIELIDVFGRNLKRFSKTNTLDLTSFENGIYFLNIMDQNSASKKTIKIVLEQ